MMRLRQLIAALLTETPEMRSLRWFALRAAVSPLLFVVYHQLTHGQGYQAGFEDGRLTGSHQGFALGLDAGRKERIDG